MNKETTPPHIGAGSHKPVLKTWQKPELLNLSDENAHGKTFTSTVEQTSLPGIYSAPS